MKKIFFSLGLILLMIITGCTAKSKEEVVELSLASNQSNTDPAFIELKRLAKEYSDSKKEVVVNVSVLNDYEPSMKTRMAANNLPDLFFTHGWSTTRYAEYAEPLQDQPWSSLINPLLKERVTDEDGNIYVLPMDVSMGGIVFDVSVLEESGVNWETIKTWEDFLDACESIKKNNKTPIGIGGLKDSWTVANFLDFSLPSFLVTNENDNFRKELLDGTFDWQNFSPLYDMFLKMYDSDFFNSNVKEGTSQDMVEAFSRNEVGFMFSGSGIATKINNINPDVKLGIMPIPSLSVEDEPVSISGENVSIAVWKDSKYKEEAIDFINWLSEPKNVNAISSVNVNPTGLVGDEYVTDTGEMNYYFESLEKYRTFGYFDRDYLPSGMWDTLTKAGETMINKTSTKEEVIKKLESDYNKLIKQ